ncbi:MAG: SPFH domain-containing protein [Clostridia bacterium]|nr:SPFH domain-containing protein [Clostridia bacterium]
MNIAKVIKYEGDNSVFVWKHPCEDFNTTSQLIVHESQEAVFFMNGQALDLFGAGRYTLETQNIPLIRNIINIPTGGRTPFHCEVYFINKTQQLAIKWGTDSQVQYMEPTYHFPLQIGASGEMVLSVNDSRKLLVKVVGTERILTRTALTIKFRSFLMSKIKPYIAKTMQESPFTIFEADSHMGELSETLHQMLIPDFNEYGITLEHFFVTNIAKPDGETAYERFKDLHIRQFSDVAEAQLKQKVGIIDEETEKKRRIIEAEGISAKRQIEGYTYAQERGFDVAEKVAENEAVGEFTNMGVGMGTMAGVGGAVGGMVGGLMNEAISQANKPQASDAPQDSMALFKQKLEKLMMMKEMGVITDEEFNQQKIKLMENL